MPYKDMEFYLRNVMQKTTRLQKKYYCIMFTNTDGRTLLDGLVYEQTDKYLLRTTNR